MEGIIICGAILAAIMFLRSQTQEIQQGAFATVRDVSDDNGASDVSAASCSVSLFEHSSLSNDDDWPINSVTDGSTTSFSYESDTSRWTDPMYAYELNNIWHGTLIDPTYHDDNSSNFDDSSSSLFDDSFSDSSSYDDTSSSSFSDDSWSSTSFDDSFSSGSSIGD